MHNLFYYYDNWTEVFWPIEAETVAKPALSRGNRAGAGSHYFCTISNVIQRTHIGLYFQSVSRYSMTRDSIGAEL